MYTAAYSAVLISMLLATFCLPHDRPKLQVSSVKAALKGKIIIP